MRINGANFIEKLVEVQQPYGLHVRPAGFIARLISLEPQKDIYISTANKEPEKLKASIMQIMEYEIHQGEKVKLFFAENYPKKLLDAIVNCFNAKDLKICEKTSDETFASYRK